MEDMTDCHKEPCRQMADIFSGYSVLLKQIKRRILKAQQQALYAANEELLRMNWDIGEMLVMSQKADG